MTCAAAACTVDAVAAVQWQVQTPFPLPVPPTRAEPVCQGHRTALERLARERGAAGVRFLTLDEYAARLVRQPTTTYVTVEDIAAAYQAKLHYWEE